MAYQRVSHSSPFSDGSSTDAAVVVNAIEAGLEAAETTIATHTTAIAAETTARTAADATLTTSVATNATAIAAETTARTAAGTSISSGATTNSGTLWVFIGDSITNGSAASNSVYSFPAIAIANVGGLIARRDSIEAGTPGDTVTMMLARSSSWLSYGAGGYVIAGGTNDAGGSTAITTTIASFISMIQLIKATGAAVVVCTVLPRGSGASAALQLSIIAINHWIKTQAPRYGAIVADNYAATVDVTTGYLLAAYDSGDGIHPTDAGHNAMAVEVAKAMRRTSNRVQPYGLVTAKETSNLIPDPLNARATVSGSSWFEQPGGTGTAPTYSMQTDTSGLLPAGRWAEMDLNNSSGVAGNRILACSAAATGWSAGDRMLFTFHAQIIDVSGTWAAQNATTAAAFAPGLTNQSGVGIAGSPVLGYRVSGLPIAGTSPKVYEFGPQAIAFTIPTGTTSLIPWFRGINATGHDYKFRIGAIGLYNLTTMGLVAYYDQSSGLINT